MAATLGGTFDPAADINFTGTVTKDSAALVSTTATQTLTNKTFTSPTISTPTLTAPVLNGVVTGTSFGSRNVRIAVQAVTGTAIHAAVANWVNPEGARIIVTRCFLDITTASTGASTLDVGVTATSATTSSDTLLDGVSGTPAALFDSGNSALDSGANTLAQSVASGKWITLAEASGDTTGMVGNLYVHYLLA